VASRARCSCSRIIRSCARLLARAQSIEEDGGTVNRVVAMEAIVEGSLVVGGFGDEGQDSVVG